MITNSLDWEQRRRPELKSQILSITYNPELRQMLRNIDLMVIELSKVEVEARRTKNKGYMTPTLDKVNDAIDALGALIVLGILLE